MRRIWMRDDSVTNEKERKKRKWRVKKKKERGE
jgi:hypothetical protein